MIQTLKNSNLNKYQKYQFKYVGILKKLKQIGCFDHEHIETIQILIKTLWNCSQLHRGAWHGRIVLADIIKLFRVNYIVLARTFLRFNVFKNHTHERITKCQLYGSDGAIKEFCQFQLFVIGEIVEPWVFTFRHNFHQFKNFISMRALKKTNQYYGMTKTLRASNQQ